MPDLERRITEELDRLGERPDTDLVIARVGARRRRARTVRRLQQATLVVVVLAGIGAGVYGLSRAFDFGTMQPIPGSTAIHPSPSPSRHHSPSPHPSSSPSPSGSAPPAIALCSDQSSSVTVKSQQGAAGTISTLWKVTNTSAASCRSFGYPGMDFHASTGWLNAQVHRGGFPDINGSPMSIVVPSGRSMFFVSYWSDVTTSGGACRQFDRVKVTLPDNTVSAQVAATGCVSPALVDVGPVTKAPPA